MRIQTCFNFSRFTSVLFLLALIASGMSLIGCTKASDSDPNTLIVALGSSPSTLDPRFATDAGGMRLGSLIFSSIVRIGPDLKIEGEAASSWTYDDARKTYRFDLRPGLTFSNGEPVTANDIEFSFEQYRDPKSPFAAAYKVIKSVEVKYDDSARFVKVSLNDFSATFLTDLSPLKILSKVAVQKAGDDFGKVLIGTGPFSFVRRDENEIVLKATTAHAYATPKIANVVFKIIRDENTRYLKMLKGEVDLAQSEIPTSKVAEFKKQPEQFEVMQYPGLSMTYLLLNLQDPALKDLKVRQAIAKSINRDEIIRYKLEGLAEPATSIITPNNPFFTAGLQNLPFDLSAASAELSKLGLKGKELTLKTSNASAAVENGKVLANQIQVAGPQVKLQSFEWGTFYDDIKKGNFQMATMKWIGSTDPDIYRMALHSKEVPPGRNRGRYNNPTFDQLVEKGVKTSDTAQRKIIYDEVQKIALSDLPFIPLWYDREVAVFNKRVEGYRPSQLGDYSGILSVTKKIR